MQVSAKEALEAENGYLVLPDICVCCGEPVPEGRQVCWKCEHQGDDGEELRTKDV